MKSISILSLLIAAMFAVQAPESFAETIYKWVDQNGTVVFGERPPEGVDAKAISVDSSPPSSGPDPYASARSKDPSEPSAAQQKREDRKKRAHDMEQQQAKIDAACIAHESRLADLEPRTNIIVVSPDGTSERMDDNERLRMVDESKAFISKNCKK